MYGQHTRPLIAQEEGSATSEWLRLDGKTILAYLHSTYSDAAFIKLLLTFLEGEKGLIFYLLVCALVAEHLELFQDLHLLGLRPIANEEDFGKTEGTGTSDDVSYVVLLTDIV